MPYIYSSADTHSVVNDGRYFIDANIWIKILQPKINQSYKEKKYRELFEAITTNNKCKIVVTSLLLSELINRIIREVYLNKFIKKFKEKNPTYIIDKEFYKNVYRPSADFAKDYGLLCYEIKTYHQSIELVNDGLGSDVKIKHLLANPSFTLDFNDNYYYQLCKKNKFIILTDDKDFWVEDVEVISLNDTLKNKNIAHILASNKN